MKEDHVTPDAAEADSKSDKTGRDARGRWKKGHCPNPNGRPKKTRLKNYNPSDLRDFMNTQIEVATVDGPQNMDRRTALLTKLFEGAMKGKATPMRILMADLKENDRQMAELRVQYERLEAKLILDNPDYKSLDESLTRAERTELMSLASTLNRYHPGRYNAILGIMDDKDSAAMLKEIKARLAEQAEKAEKEEEAES